MKWNKTSDGIPDLRATPYGTKMESDIVVGTNGWGDMHLVRYIAIEAANMFYWYDISSEMRLDHDTIKYWLELPPMEP